MVSVVMFVAAACVLFLIYLCSNEKGVKNLDLNKMSRCRCRAVPVEPSGQQGTGSCVGG